MEALFAVALGILTASGVYLLLRARTFPVVMGLTLISYAVNLFLFAMGRLLLFGARLSMPVKRSLSLSSTAVLVLLSFWLMWQADQGVLQVYALGNWQPPFGIILLLDRLSALLLVATTVLAFFALLYATRGDDERGRNFHALFQFQLMGLNGAFLTGDLLYLLAVGVLYGITGTLNMADMAVRVAAANADQAPLLGAAGLLLLVVFGLKAAFLPLYFWLPRAYASATAPVAALFAIMTKVGLYSILRVYTLIFGDDAGMLANMAQEWLWPLALLTIGLGVIGALAASSLHGLLAYLLVVSVGTLLAGISLGTPQALAAALYYLLHSTWIAGGLFLLADLVARQRGEKTTQLIQGPALQNPHLLGILFFIGAISVAGLPPLSGFIGKLLLLRAVEPGLQALFLWPVVLGGGLATLIALSRAGSTLFWRVGLSQMDSAELDSGRLLACIGLLLLSPLLVGLAAPLLAYVEATAAQLLDLQLYRQILVPGGAS